MKNNQYVVVKKTFDVDTEVYYENTFAEALRLLHHVTFQRAAEEGDTSSEWFIAVVENEPISKTTKWLYRLIDKLNFYL